MAFEVQSLKALSYEKWLPWKNENNGPYLFILYVLTNNSGLNLTQLCLTEVKCNKRLIINTELL